MDGRVLGSDEVRKLSVATALAANGISDKED